MKMFSDCSGACETCANSGGCLAGHGDDDYVEDPVKAKEHRESLTASAPQREQRRQQRCGFTGLPMKTPVREAKGSVVTKRIVSIVAECYVCFRPHLANKYGQFVCSKCEAHNTVKFWEQG